MSDPAPLLPSHVETERLRLTPRTPAHVDTGALYRICSSEGMEEVTKWMPWSAHETPNETHEFLEDGREAWDEATSAAYVVRPGPEEDGAGEIAGAADLHLDWERRVGTLGLWLRRRFWGRGYSGERAAAMVELAFDRLGLEVVRVSHDPRNGNSRRAIERYVDRLGGRRDGTFRRIHPDPDETAVDQTYYSIDRDDWRDAVGDERVATVRWG
ncbi:GNAT family N-acetyltransferase [Halobium salinum]|uniref:GNAT family N-acetyltransferase n=1 Tax=Halobium salinum TaxID=1364940 RepID=A0ABD5P8D7_9EURY|nr:GNAT family N-acetyltransferase [Halobium salinum]